MAGTALLQLVIKAKDQSLKTLDKNRSSLKKLGKAAALAGGAAGLAAGVASVAALKMALDFDKAMGEVKTLLPDLDKEGFALLKQSVLEFSKETGVATKEAVPALYQAISAGVPKENVFEFMKIASAAAIGGVTDLETAVDGITSVVNSYGSDVIDAQKASDIMFTAVKLGKTDFNQLSKSLFNVIPTAASLGVSFEDVAAQLAVMTAQGVPTSVATTQMRAGFVELSKSGTKLATFMDVTLGKSFKELIGEGKSTSEIFNLVAAKAKETGTPFNSLFGSVEAYNAAIAVSGKNSQKTKDALSQMTKSTGATQKAFSTIGDTAAFKLQKAMNSIKIIATDLGLLILPIATKAIGELQKGFTAISEWFNQNREGIESAIKAIFDGVEELWGIFSSGLSVVFPILRDFVAFIIRNKPLLIVAIAAIGVAIFLAMGPASQAILAITGIILAIGFLKDNWDSIKDKIAEVFGIIEGLFKSKWGWILPGGPLIKAILFLKDNWREIWDSAKAKATEIFDFISRLFKSKWGWILPGGPLIKAILFLKNNWREIWDSIVNTTKTTFDKLKGMANAFLATYLGIFNAIITAWNSIEFKIPKVTVLGRTFGGGKISPPKIPLIPIPSFDHGGVVPGPLGKAVLVQARGGERFLGAGSRARSMGGSITNNFYGDIIGVDDLDRRIKKTVRDEAVKGGFSGVFAPA